jgi:hypothetical protein
MAETGTIDVEVPGIVEALMFRVTADSLQAYLNFDPARKPDLVKLDKLLAETAPTLKRYFHRGTPAGEAGMRMTMIGYGKFRYAIKSGKTTEWPVIGVALQKHYISVHVSVTKAGVPLVPAYKGKLGELRMGGNNFSFVTFGDLTSSTVASLFAEADGIFRSDPENPVRHMQGM